MILAKTVKGYGLGKSGESVNISHQMKKMSEDELREFRDRYRLPISDAKLKDAPFYKPPEDSAEMVYLRERREALGGYLPARRRSAPALEVPGFEIFEAQAKGSGEREISTTMAFVRLLTALTRDKQLGPHVVPIVPDEARTFGMEGLFRTLGIYSSIGQLYDPVDADQVMYYHEHKEGPDPGGRPHGGRLDVVVHRRGHVVFVPRRADDPLLHLLFDVRLPAHRRPRLGRRRQPGARLPARRHLRAHDARGRRARSTRTATATCWPRRSRTAAPTIRPTPTSSR